MTPLVAIALITKLKLIFETDADGNKQSDKFLAFQNGAFPVSKENFYFIEPDKYKIGPIDTALRMMDFSKSFNFITTVDDFISPTTDELEDVYHRTLQKAIGANSNRSHEEEQRYNAAKDFLYETVQTPDGQTITRMANYDYYDNQYKEALSEYKSRELAAVNAQGESAVQVKAAWQNDIPDLKKAIAISLLNFENLGQRSAVEKYLGDLLSLSGSSPSKTIADLKIQYELFATASSVDHLANELKYIPTYFTPINFFDDNLSWQALSLDKSEVNALMQQAPQRLKNLFEIDTKDVDMNKISFEYIVVSIVRDWLHYKDFLLQRFWKFSDMEKSLSDGTGNGPLPAFPEKMIFVRNLKIERPGHQPAETNGKSSNFLTQLFQKLKPQVVDTQLRRTAIIDSRKIDTVKMKMMVLEKEKAIAKPVIHGATMMPLPVIPINAIISSAALSGKPSEIKKKPVMATIQPMLYKAELTTTFRKPLDPVMKFSRHHTALTSPGSKPVVTEHKEMELLAFLCRKVPPCPLPDPQLKWD
jgi:hypothetical protein